MEEEPHISSTLLWQDVSLPSAITEADLDSAILAAMRRDFLKTARIVGDTVTAFKQRGLTLDHEIVGARIRELAARGTIESAGNVSMWRHSEVRLPL